MMRTARALATAALGLLVLLTGAGPAHADGYRYWSFWTAEEGSWVYATQGPATLRPADGDVVGFRFTVSESAGEGARPRQRADFEAVCADTAPREGRKRVALVIDPGTHEDAPRGETPPRPWRVCASVAPDASVGDALAATAPPLRYDSSALLCAIAGYPETECGARLGGSDGGTDGAGDGGTDAGNAAEEGDDGGSGFPWVIVCEALVVLALGAAGVWQARRRRAS
ncbi:hypothetical protein HPT28_05740 [Streptomyces sp. JJ38]|nr:hypothetical protein [Streptomyces sp. JJ38]